MTTTVCGAAGGRGAASRKTPAQVTESCERIGLDPASLVYASRTAAKVDSATVQDGYQLYHHAFFFTAAGEWCIVPQGMSDCDADNPALSLALRARLELRRGSRTRQSAVIRAPAKY